ncbi:hypothetical protein TeGR_g5725 [Tetraparma gracilis]|uniref:N-acetylglucosamine-6-phosphate deacetylase n=1 Tax=Tetraparma gracilis TaxID=2962635 RepID=A0ABQ6M8S6_9STRA|nr:hypothetical protein TeGR_g5725 [Tetraparma gracilis]
MSSFSSPPAPLQFVNCLLPSPPASTTPSQPPSLAAPSLAALSLFVDSSSGLILDSRTAFYGNPPSTPVDCGGDILAPGFVDIQLNGAFGVDFSAPSLSLADVAACSARLLSTGVTSYCPTLVSLSPPVYAKVLPVFSSYLSSPPPSAAAAAAVLGVHAEGPFFNPSMRGAHEPSNIVPPSPPTPATFSSVYGAPIDRSPIVLTTLAPEQPGALPFIELLTDNRIKVSLGHSAADYETGVAAVGAGATLLTHLYNQMTPFHHRKPGLIALLASPAPPNYSIIADGVHVAPAAVRCAWEMSRKMVLVTDAMAAMGLGDGAHKLGTMDVTKEGGRAVLTGTETLAGSVASMELCVRKMKEFTGCGAAEAIWAATGQPASVLGLEDRGNLRAGSRADLVLLDKDTLEVKKTYLGGRLVWERDK